jgi:hypothetical protein
MNIMASSYYKRKFNDFVDKVGLANLQVMASGIGLNAILVV